MQRKIFILLLILSSITGILCDINFEEISGWEEGFVATNSGHNFYKHDNKILFQTQRGIEFYEIDSENNLDLILDYPLSNLMFAEFRNNNLVVSSENDRNEFPYMITLYDISDLESIEIVHELFSDTREFTIQDDYLAVSNWDFYENRWKVDVYSLHTLELLNTHYNYKIEQSIYDSNKFVVIDFESYIAKIMFINDEGMLNVVGELNSNGKVIIRNNKLLVLRDNDVSFYEIDDSLEYLSSYSFTEADALADQGVFYNEEILGFHTVSRQPPFKSYITLYNVLDLTNIFKIDDIQLTEFDDSSLMLSTDTITFNNSFLHCYSGYGLVQYNYTNNLLRHELLKSSAERTYYEKVFFKNNIYYDNFVRIALYNHQIDLENFNSIELLETSDTLGNIFFFGDDYQHKIVKNYETSSFDFYLENNEHDFDFIDSYQLLEYFDYFRFIDILDWNGEDLFFSFGNKLSYVNYQNSAFSVISVLDNVGSQVKWAKYNNYIYKISSNSTIDVYEINNQSLQLVNTITLTNGNRLLFYCGVADGILTIQYTFDGGRAYDLIIDPINLSNELFLDFLNVSSNVRRYNDYLIYCGSNSNIDIHGFQKKWKYLNFYKKVDDNYVYLGEVFCDYYVNNIEIIPINSNNFNLIVRTQVGFKIFSCEVTNNEDFEITPLSLNSTNYPNPFNPETTILYDLAKAGNVRLDIYNLKGQKVKSLVNEVQDSGKHTIIWQGDNQTGDAVSSGVYLYKLKASGKEEVKKMTLMK